MMVSASCNVGVALLSRRLGVSRPTIKDGGNTEIEEEARNLPASVGPACAKAQWALSCWCVVQVEKLYKFWLAKLKLYL
jgi:hypothetical protein